jgi:hypothetical protein
VFNETFLRLIWIDKLRVTLGYPLNVRKNLFSFPKHAKRSSLAQFELFPLTLQFLGVFYCFCSYRVQHHISAYFKQMAFLLD